jgi:hypothetical protein
VVLGGVLIRRFISGRHVLTAVSFQGSRRFANIGSDVKRGPSCAQCFSSELLWKCSDLPGSGQTVRNRAITHSKNATFRIIFFSHNRRRTNISHLLYQVRRRSAAQSLEVMDHVHLVVIAEAMRNIQPGSLWRD